MEVTFIIQQKRNPDLWQIFMKVTDKAFKPPVKYYTGRKINPSDKHWDKKKYKGIGTDYNSLNSRLRSLEGMALTIFDGLEKEANIDRTEFINRLCIMDGKEDRVKVLEEKTIWSYLNDFYKFSENKISKSTKQKLSEGSLKRVEVMINNLKKFDEAYSYELTPYKIATEDFYNKFAKFFTGSDEGDLGNATNSLSDPINHIKQFCKWLRKQIKDLPMDWEEFQRPSDYDEDDIDALLPEEIARLWNLDLSLMPQVEMSYWIGMNMLSSGMRISDHNFYDENSHIINVEGQKVSGKFISFKNVKAGTECNVPLIDDDFFRPAFVHRKFKELYGSKPTKTSHDFNRDLPVILKAARISRVFKKDKSRIFRKSFATNRLRQGYEIYEVMKMGGWRDEKQFRRYAGIDKVDILKSVLKKQKENKNETAPKD